MKGIEYALKAIKDTRVIINRDSEKVYIFSVSPVGAQASRGDPNPFSFETVSKAASETDAFDHWVEIQAIIDGGWPLTIDTN